ncbi:trimethylamine methyltransferase family protein [Fuchsiella alkaliacetigena]|uniref:trimethylamine methyltransferase family protein n=1 Tax=Fuchsiella alkaliacetigena TaxID=957042 RepID=UPI00200A194B|nr:trimethylamine methyltransferase family protein [Fuchsiella alkaliacetigena]MCK8823729.1 trimethylamine methyltransferase family protein [Fuchsiella alkaliacetigena]
MIERKIFIKDILSAEDLEMIHQASIELLTETGIEVLHEKAREIFAENGARVEDTRVYLSEELLEEYLAKAPSSFTLHARNPDNNVTIGGDNSVLAPGYGAPYVTDLDEGRRDSTFEDYQNFTKLAAASENIDVLGGVIVEPTDIADQLRHVKMLYVAAKYSDKCLMGSALGSKKAKEAFQMASLLFGEEDIIDDRAIVISLINTTSPLKYDHRMLDALITHAEYNQAAVIASLIMAGSTGPMSIAGTLTLQNVEVLTGVVLAQMINPGTPVVYGSATTITDMKTANLAIGSPEYAKFVGSTAQLARYYGLPCRAGGSITDSLLADTQAGYESMMTFISSINHGLNFILHSAGLLENYMTMSYEKFIIDDEILGMINNYQAGVEVSEETVAKEVIQEVGPGGHYLSHAHTLEHMRDFREPILSQRAGFDGSSEIDSTVERANQKWKEVLADFEAPPLDPKIENKLKEFMEQVANN